MKNLSITISILGLLCLPVSGQGPANPAHQPAAEPPTVADKSQGQSAPPERSPIYRVTVVQRSIAAVNYGHRTGPTKIDFKGTVLLPDSPGRGDGTGRSGSCEDRRKAQTP